jgi:hypothetical protein
MKKILEFLKRWFEHYGIIKILIAFTVLAISVALGRRFENEIFGWIAITSGAYIIITFLVFFVAGIVNTINDIRNANKNKKG